MSPGLESGRGFVFSGFFQYDIIIFSQGQKHRI
jgi:hypothetical protein